MRLETLPHLRHEIEQTFSRKIRTSADCIQLAEAVYKKTGKTINPNTLRRCFQLVKSAYPPSVSTLNILSNYCGFSTLEEFVEYKNRKPAGDESNKPLLSFLVNLFRNLEVSQNDVTYINMVGNIIQHFKLYPSIIHDFQKEVAKTLNGQKYYFETFINIDQLKGYYGEGLRYYLAEKKCADGQIFGNWLLLLRAWLIMDKPSLLKHYKEIEKYTLHEEMPVATQAYYLASEILFFEINGKENSSILQRVLEKYNKLKNPNLNLELPHFLRIISEVMILAKEYREALYYSNEGLNLLRKQTVKLKSTQRFNSLFLFKTIALRELGETEASKKIFREINREDFHFLSKNYLNIFYLRLDSEFNAKGNNADQMKFLVQKTGFKKLEGAITFQFIIKKPKANQL